MRYLKSQNLDKYRRTDYTVSNDASGNVTINPNTATKIYKHTIFNSTSTITLPNGTTVQRPGSPLLGDMRFNTDTNEMEIYNGNWRAIRYKEPNSITVQTLGIGDYSTVVFGPLTIPSINGYNTSDGTYLYGNNFGANILVFVENVFQIFNTNYIIQQNPLGFPVGWYIEFGDPPPNKAITVIYGFDS